MSKTIYEKNVKVSIPLVHDDLGYFHLVYQITNLVNGKIYIGKHSTKNPYDNYMGSGIAISRAIEKYGIENFIKEIIFCSSNEKEAFLKEAEIVNLEFVKNENTYNVVVGGNMIAGCWSGENHPMYGKHLSQEIRDKISDALKGDKSPNFGKHPSKETREKLSNAAKKRHGENHPMYGKSHSQETKDKMSRAHKGEKNPNFGKSPTQETRDKLSNSLKGKLAGEKHPMYGRRGEKSPGAKIILKLDKNGNTIIEYGCMKECCTEEKFSYRDLRRLLKMHVPYNEFYFEYKNEK